MRAWRARAGGPRNAQARRCARLPAALLAALFLFPGVLSAGGSFDSGYGIWSPSGLWHRVTGSGCVTPHSGTACVYYGLDTVCDYATGLPQDASLSTTQPVTLTASTAFISFWLLYEVQSYDPACQDRLRLEYSPNGTQWYLAAPLGPQADPVGGSPIAGLASGSGLDGPPLWQFEDIDLSSFAGTAYDWRFRYLSSDEMAGDGLCSAPDLLQQTLGYALDDITLGGAAAPLALDLGVAPSVAAPGGTFTYTISVTNTASDTATLRVWEPLPAGYASATASGGGVVGSGQAQWTLAAMAPGQAQTVQVQVQSSSGQAVPTNWISSAYALSSLSTTAVESSQVLAKIRAPVLTLSKSVSPTHLASGATATYSLVVENDSPQTLTALTLSDDLPPAFTPAQAYPALSGPASWTLGSVAPGQVLSFMLAGPVLGHDGQVVVNSAQVTGSTTTPQATASLTLSNPVAPAVRIAAVFPNPAPSHVAGQPQKAFVAYSLSQAMPMTLDIYDVAGQKIRSLGVSGLAGEQQAAWDLKNAYGLPVASGLYVLRLWSSQQAQPPVQATATLAVRR